MAHVLLFPSVLGVRQGITDLAGALAGAGHAVTVIDVLAGETFDDYESGLARSASMGLPAQLAASLERAKGVAGPFVAVGFSNGAGSAQWVAANRPEDARGVLMVGGGVPMRFLGISWPSGVPGQVHVTAQDPFHEVERQFDDEIEDDVEHAGGQFAFVEYQGNGHLFSDPSLRAEYQPQEARVFTERVLEFVAAVG